MYCTNVYGYGIITIDKKKQANKRGGKKNMKITRRMENEIMNMLLTNNSRRMAGLPTHRKGNKGRDNNMEVIGAFLDYCDGKYERKCKRS